MIDRAAAPLEAAEFSRLMDAVAAPRDRLAAACSGGSDSLALTLLAAEWAASRGCRFLALIVDHGLREESAAEAERVGGWLKDRGIAHRVLRHFGPRPASDVQAWARDIRYTLLADACGEAGILHLLLGHHREDQAETFLLRLARGSGVDGLGAMAPVSRRGKLTLLRPLLAIAGARLSATLATRGQGHIEDPSNNNPDFSRVRMRRLLPTLAIEGLDAPRLAETAARMRRAQDALDLWTDRHLLGSARMHAAGFATLSRAAWRQAPEEIRLRSLMRLLQGVGGNALPPRLKALEAVERALADGSRLRARTLMGCRILEWRGEVLLCREASAIATAPLGSLWDGRYLISLPATAQAGGLRLSPLGEAGWQDLPRFARRNGMALPGAVRRTLPALLDLEGVRAVPHLNFYRRAEDLQFSAEFQPRGWPGPVVASLPDQGADLC